MDEDRLDYLAQIASWYYEDNLSQEAIAKRIGRSPSMISRLLQEARDNNLIEIRVRFPLKRNAELEERLRETFGLAQAWVLANPPSDKEALFHRLGKLGARCLQQHLQDNVKIGIGWGTAVYHVVRAMPTTTVQGATVIQVIGSIGSGDPTVDGTQMARWLAEKLDATTRILHAPLIVENRAIVQSLLQDPAIAETLRWTTQVDVTLLGVGTTDPVSSGMRRAGYMSEATLQALQQAGAVGDILGFHLDINGNVLDVSLNQRVIGASIESLRRVPTSIVVASGDNKVLAVLATLRGGYADILITDAATASAVLTHHAEPAVTTQLETLATQ